MSTQKHTADKRTNNTNIANNANNTSKKNNTNDTSNMNISKILCLDDLHHLFDSEQGSSPHNSPHNTRHLRKDELYRRLGITSRDSFAKKILPVNIYLVLTAKHTAKEILRYSEADKNRLLREKGLSQSSRSTLNRVFNSDGNNSAKERCRQVVSLLTEKRSLNYDTFATSNYRKEIADRWRSILVKLQDEEKSLLRARIQRLIDRFPEKTQNCDNIKKRLQMTAFSNRTEAFFLTSDPTWTQSQTASDIHTEAVLASLTLIACTFHIWEQYDSDFDYIAQDIILLPLSETEEEQPPSKKILHKNTQLAKKQLHTIQQYIDTAETAVSEPQKCYQVCQSVLNILPLDDKTVLGRTYYILYLCCKNRHFVSPDGIPAAEYLRQSQKYQYDAALRTSSEQSNNPLYSPVFRSKSSRNGLCVTNVNIKDVALPPINDVSPTYDVSPIYGMYPANGVYSTNGGPRLQTLLDSSPENWKWKLLDNNFCTDPSIPIKYFLFDENEEKNFTDLLKVLSFYKINSRDDCPYDVEIYILGNSSQIGNLVDTAQHKMPGSVVPVHIINEERRTAQFLLAKHPLFFPVMEKLKNEETPKPKTLHFVILGTDECAEYLAREASWMMTFPHDTVNITPKITLVGSNASVIQQHILSKCPGLQDNEHMTSSCEKKRCENRIIPELYAADLNEAVRYPCRIYAKYVPDYHSVEFEKFLYGCLTSGETLCFAISLPDSMASLAAAISLREKIIQYIIAAKCSSSNKNSKDCDNTKYLHNMPPIAFRCTDYNIAHMSRDLVVSKVDHGFSWYNNHMIIPFGTYYELYGWDNLTNNLAEHLSQCIHILYDSLANTHCPGLKQPHGAGEIGETAGTCRTGGIGETSKDIGSEKTTEIDREHAFLQKLKSHHRTKLAEYYKRQYNKDSSFSAALSMPYRLFCLWLILKSQGASTDIIAARSKKAQQILSRIQHYDINYADGFLNEANLNTLAKACAFLKKDDADVAEILNKLAAWEHSRWNNWMISEGWLPASIERMRFYKRAGSGNNQLYIGKLHPALCSCNKLKEVEEALKNPDNPKDSKTPTASTSTAPMASKDSGPAYRKYDIGSIRNTDLILRGACELHRLEQSDLEPESSKD